MLSKKDKIGLDGNLNRIMKYIRAFMGPGMNKVSEITTHILISNTENAEQLSVIKEYGIKSLLYFGSQPKDPKILKTYQKKKLNYLQIPIGEKTGKPPNLMQYLDSAYQFIHQSVLNEEKVLLHCNEGVSLSVAFLIYYLLRRYYITNFKSSKDKTKDLIDPEITFILGIIKFLKELRPCIEPKADYIYQLLV